MKIIVTGGAGFIGSALVRALLDCTWARKVAVVDNLITGSRANLHEVAGDVEFHEADVRNTERLTAILRGSEIVFHQAALPSVPRSIRDPETSHSVNIGGTFSVFHAAAQAGVRRVVYAASSSAYGDTPTLPKAETMPPRPKSPYAVQKLTGELYAQTFHENFGLETVALRYFNIFGPRQDPSSPYSGVVSLFCKKILARQAPTIFGDGQQSRDFTYVDNAVEANLLAAQSSRAVGEVLNVGCGSRITLIEMWRRLLAIEGVEIEPEFGPPRAGDVRHSLADIDKARELLGYAPHIDAMNGLERTLDWYRAQPS